MFYVPVDGDGWCFYESCRLQLNLEDRVSKTVLLGAAITLLANRKAEFMATVVHDEESQVRYQHLRTVPAYSAHVDRLTPFDVYVLDKMEAAFVPVSMRERR